MTARTAKAKKITTESLSADIQGKAKIAYAKGAAVAGELGTIAKGNVGAVVASGKILGAGLKELGEGSVAESKQAAQTLVADFKALAALKTPKDFLDFQVKLAKRNFDTVVALGGKNGKAIGKLASDTAGPLSAQVKATVAKLRKAA